MDTRGCGDIFEKSHIEHWEKNSRSRIYSTVDVDPERAKAGPFGATIAHGYLTLSLANLFLPQLMEVRNVAMGVNYGCEKVRFPAPVPVGSRVRGRGEVLSAQEVKGGVQVVVRVTVEVEGSERPACVVDTMSRFYPTD